MLSGLLGYLALPLVTFKSAGVSGRGWSFPQTAL
jgi:hypothetical protein